MFRYLSLFQSASNSMDLLWITLHTSRDFCDWNRIRLFVTIHPNTIKESSRASNKGNYIQQIGCRAFHKIHFLFVCLFFSSLFPFLCFVHFLYFLNWKWQNPDSLKTNIRTNLKRLEIRQVAVERTFLNSDNSAHKNLQWQTQKRKSCQSEAAFLTTSLYRDWNDLNKLFV